MNKKILTSSIIASLFLGGCTTSHINENIGKISGTIIGSAGGAAIGKKIAGDKGKVIGALIGGSIGYFIGDEIDQRRQNIEQIAKEENIQLQFTDLVNEDDEKVGQSLLIEDYAQFDSGKNELNNNAKKYFIKIAKEYANSNQKIMIAGHTDHDGSNTYNQKLSEKRALTIAKLFEKNGVKKENIYFYGVGELEPIADNFTRNGKSKNRRVEIIEAPTELDLAKYAAMQQSNKTLTSPEKQAKNNNKENGKLAKAEPLPKYLDTPQENPSTSKNANTSNLLNKMGALFSDFGSKKDLPEQTTLSSKSRLQSSQDGMITHFGDGDYKVKGQCNNNYWFTDNNDFVLQGTPTTRINKNDLIDISGAHMPTNSGFSLLNEAKANNKSGYYTSCINDSFKRKGEIKSYSTGREVVAKDLGQQIPWMQGSVWLADIGGVQMIVTPVGVYKKNIQPSTCPEVAFVKKGERFPQYATSTNITTYKGKEAFIYRVFPQDTSRFQCADIAFPYQNNIAPKGVMYFKDKGKQYKKEFEIEQVVIKGEV